LVIYYLSPGCKTEEVEMQLIGGTVKRLVIVTFAILLIAGMAQSEVGTDIAKLAELKAEFDAKWERWQGPEYQAAKLATTGYYGEINADPNRQLMGFDDQGDPVIYYTTNANAALSTRTNRIMQGGISGYNLTGSTINRMYHWDNSTANINHPEFSGRVIVVDGGASNQSHANHTAGTMMASGVSASAKGMATGATIYSHNWDWDESEMSTGGANGAKVSSHSYYSGNGYGAYASRARDYDQVANAAPQYLICISAGNAGSGWDTINSSNTAKNAMVVGAVNDVPNYTGPGSVSTASFSSRGPCNDDRLKPDIVGNGVNLYSCNINGYTTMSGTSMSTPNVAGSAYLLIEQYHQTHSNIYANASTIKAAIIHTALECGSWDGPDYRYGWGLMDSEGAAELIEYDGVVNEDAIVERWLGNGTEDDHPLTVDGSEPLRVTIVWNDPAAAANAGTALINDLDIRLVQVGPNITTMPWVLNGNTNSPAAHGDNTADNVEQIWIENPNAGSYVVTVSHKGTIQGSIQSYSLIITGGTTGELPEATLSLTPVANFISPGGGNMIYNVDFSYNGNANRPNSSYWVMALMPNGNTYGPVFQYDTTFFPGQNIITQLSHYVPGNAPGGIYEITGYVGTYPNDVIASDTFEMTKWGNAPDGLNGSWPQDDQEIAAFGNSFEQPLGYVLGEAYPNPFNPTTSFSLQLPDAASVNLAVFNVNGQQVQQIADGQYSAGTHQFSFDGSNLSAGVYFLRASVPGQLNEVRKLALVK
jgi:Subtilase family/Secretion system C-terminal sorting domain